MTWTDLGRLVDVATLGTLTPVDVLYEYEGPRVFTSVAPDGSQLLAYVCAESASGLWLLVVPSAEYVVSTLKSGRISLRDAFDQTQIWLVKQDLEGNNVSVRRITIDMVPTINLPQRYARLTGEKSFTPNSSAPKVCHICTVGLLKESFRDEQFDIAGELVVVEVSCEVCDSCGESIVTGAEATRAHLVVAAELAQRGRQSGTSLRFMRKALGLKSGEAAKLLGVAPETFSRWETGDRPADRMAVALLGVMAVSRLIRDWPCSLSSRVVETYLVSTLQALTMTKAP